MVVVGCLLLAFLGRGYGNTRHMKLPLSKSTGSSQPPKYRLNEKLPEPLGIKRDQAWYSELTQKQYNHYYDIAWRVAYLMLNSPHLADCVANKVMDELYNREEVPSQADIEAHIRVLARYRSIDRFRTKSYQFQRMWRSFTQKNDNGEDYESLPDISHSASAEEEFYIEMENERFVQLLVQGILHLDDLSRACFLLVFMEKLKG